MRRRCCILVTTRLIQQAFKTDQFVLVIVYGPLRIGKSSYALQVLAELLGTWDWNVLKNYIGCDPHQVLDRWMTVTKKEIVYVWDDAGLWLHALDWNSPFVRSVGKYLNVAGTDWGGLILTAPLPTWVSRKIRGVPQAITIKIIKKSGHAPTMRIARAYRWWTHPDMRKTGVKKVYEDDFDIMLPNETYIHYKPFRETFARTAKQLMYDQLKTIRLPDPEKMKKVMTEYTTAV